jgi:WASH complex subunit strumpellin
MLAKLTHEISVCTEGMLVLDKVLMGVIEIEPKEILIDGLRKELGRTLA